MDEIYPCHYKKTNCPHCGEDFLIEFDTREQTINVYIPDNSVIASRTGPLKTRTNAPMGDRRFKVNRLPKKTAGRPKTNELQRQPTPPANLFLNEAVIHDVEKRLIDDQTPYRIVEETDATFDQVTSIRERMTRDGEL